MPKLKTKSGAKKRFKITGTGKVVYAHAASPRHDQTHHQADPQSAWHERVVQDRRRQRQEFFLRTADPLPLLKFPERSRMSRVKRGVTAHAKHKKSFAPPKLLWPS